MGTFVYANGDKYVGMFKDGRRQGQGTFTSDKGEKYVGEFREGNINGQGTYNYSTGNTYVGEWKSGQREGRGTFTWTNGQTYVGEWKDGRRSGYGTHNSPNGNKYVGDWKDDKANGQGTEFRSDGTIAYVGEFSDGKRSGRGAVSSSTGSGLILIGEFRDGKINGEGIEYLSTGRRSGRWENNTLVQPYEIDLTRFPLTPEIKSKLASPLSERTKVVQEIQEARKARDFFKVRTLVTPLAQNGDSWAENILAGLERRGDGGPKDVQSGLSRLKRLVDKSYNPALTNYGIVLVRGLGLSKDVPEGLRLLGLAAEKGDAGALNVLGNLHYEGTGVKQDFSQALSYWEKSVAAGGATAKASLAFAYLYGHGTAVDYAKAVLFAKEAADQGVGGGYGLLGIIYKDGLGVEKNTLNAVANFEEAAKRRDLWGQVLLAQLILEGGVPLKSNEAARELLKSALDNEDDSLDSPKHKRLANLLLGKLEGPNSTTATQAATVLPVASQALKAVNAHALVIGNAAYPGSGKLENPVNDSRAMSAKLRSMGFKVTEVEDANRAKLVTALGQFSRSAALAELSLLFYSGHGVQMLGTNYILPTDIDQSDLGQATIRGISLDSVVSQFLPGKTKLVFLDACRDNPLYQAAANKSFSKGLAPISVAEGTLIAYATKDGQVASDGGKGAKNSPFTVALLEHLSDPDDIAVVLRRVREKVKAATGGKQVPWDYGSLTGGALILSAIKPTEGKK